MSSSDASRYEAVGRFARRASILALFCAALALPARAGALPGTHAQAISTYDARASNLVFGYQRGLISGGGIDTLSANANFSATSGKLSAQFGIHYLDFHGPAEDSEASGAAATAIALFVFPLGERFDNGVPRSSLGFYLGAAPTALIGGDENFMSLPFPLGIVLPLSPGSGVTFTPWLELAPGFDFDTVVKPIEPGQIDTASLFNDPARTQPNPPPTCRLVLGQDQVEAIVTQGIDTELSSSLPMRVGAEFAIHMTNVDLNLYGSLSSLGSSFSGTGVWRVGAGLVFRWDSIVPGVLPPERRPIEADCNTIEQRFRSCPAAQRWQPVAPAVTQLPPSSPAAAQGQSGGTTTAPSAPVPPPAAGAESPRVAPVQPAPRAGRAAQQGSGSLPPLSAPERPEERRTVPPPGQNSAPPYPAETPPPTSGFPPID